MATLLHIAVSPRGGESISRQLAEAAVQHWKERDPHPCVVERDLAKTPLTFVDLNWIQGAFSRPEHRTGDQKKALALSDELISELLEADVIIVSTPMYNFAVPAALKAWIDLVVRAGRTFRYTGAGTAEGLVKGTKALVIISSAGTYIEGTESAVLDHEIPYLRFIFAVMGIHDVRFVRVGGTARVQQGKVSAEAFLASYMDDIAAAFVWNEEFPIKA